MLESISGDSITIAIVIICTLVLNGVFTGLGVYIGSHGGKRIIDRYLTTKEESEKTGEIKDKELEELAKEVKSVKAGMPGVMAGAENQKGGLGLLPPINEPATKEEVS